MTEHLLIADAPLAKISSKAPEPVEYAAELYAAYVGRAADDTRRSLGQFFTPPAVARFMAQLAVQSVEGRCVRVLEPGAGTGVLTAAICEQLPDATEEVHLDAYEVHEELADLCEETFRFAARHLEERNVRCTYVVHRRDFVLDNGETLTSNLFGVEHARYDVAISNPPYFKLQKADPRARAAAHVVHGQPNIYAVFMAIMASLLREGGTMVSITPRSFTTGDYFRRFRDVLFSAVTPESIHLFDSRRDAFKRDEVLQENVIVRARRRAACAADCVAVTSSAGVSDLDHRSSRSVPVGIVVDRSTSQTAIHIPTNDLCLPAMRRIS